MNGALYFEEHPWQRCCRQVKERDLGPVHEIAVQAVCQDGDLEATLRLWLTRCEDLLGTALTGEELSVPGVISFVGAAGDCVVRIFVDASGSDVADNFEIVTARSLVVWKPGTSLQGRTTGGYTCTRQQYVADLEVKA